MNPITMQLVADEYIRMALKEDINSEDVSTNAVMPEYRKGEVQLLAKADGIIAGLQVFERVFKLLDEATEIKFEVKDGDTVTKVSSAFAGIRACVCVLIGSAVVKLAKKSLVDKGAIAIAAVVFVLSLFTSVSPALLVVVAGAIGIVLKGGKGEKK